MIAIFDSGFGGLTIFKEIKKLLPQYDYIYLGDSLRTPYGGRSKEAIYKFSLEAVEFLFKKGIQLIIIACHSASALALRKLQQDYLVYNHPDRKILGVVRPLVEQAVKATRYGRIGVVGTLATISSSAFQKELNHLKNDLQLFAKACPLLVPLIEEGWDKRPETRMILKKYLRPLKQQKIDTLILGCTHYPILFKDFKRLMGKNCQVLNSGEIVAQSLINYLKRHPEIEKKLSKNKNYQFLTTDNKERFERLGSRFLGESIRAELVELVN